MRTFILLCCTSAFSFTSSNLFAQDAKVFIETEQTLTIFEVFELIAKQTDCTFIYQSDIFTDVPKIHLKNGEIKVMTLLSRCLPAHRFEISSNKDNLITISRRSPKNLQKDLRNDLQKDQQQEIKGKIKDVEGMPIAGAAIMVVGTKRGSASDFDGNYTITAMPSDTLKVSYLGYTTVTIPINNRTTIDVTLQEDATALKEVQINAGYYTTTDREKTGSISRITSKEIEKQSVNNPLGAMQGYMSGVNIVQTTGVPGGGYDIQIRGKNFINGGTEPLYIIDGVPLNPTSLGAMRVSGQILSAKISPLNGINPQDIQSIEVLKDADATAIYGSRGANGVVLITTKKGSVGPTQFGGTISSTVGVVSNFLPLLNTEQFLNLRREGIGNDGFGAFLDNPQFDFFWPDVKSWDNFRYTDWQKELIGGTAYKNIAALSISGGSAQTQFLINGAHQKETTVFPGDAFYNKTTVHNKVNHQSTDKRFKFSWSSMYSAEQNQLPRNDFTFLAYTLAPNAPKLFDDSGNYNWENNTFDNPMASLEEEYHSKINSLNTSVSLSFLLRPNLELKSNLGYNTYDLASYRILPSSARNPSLGFTPKNYSTLNTNDSKRKSWIAEPQLNWSLDYAKFKINLLLGTTFQKEGMQKIVLNAKGFPNSNLINNISAAEKIEVIEDVDSEYKYHAIFTRLNLNWRNKYILNLTGRRDGSSRFGPGRQFGNFGALGLAWLFSEENIFTDESILSYGKLRTSLGTTGSDNIGDYQFLNTYKVLGYNYNGATALEPSGIFNPIFGWEENNKVELALELGFFRDRLLLNTAWFRNRSSNQLIGIPLPFTTGFMELKGNFDATVENSGFEVDFRSINIKTTNFNWTTTWNLSVPRNKLIKFDGLQSSTFKNKLVIGKPISIVKLYHALGVNTETGLYEFEDYNMDGKISTEDKEWLEDLKPKFFGGINNFISYKNITLDFLFQFKNQKAYNTFRWNATPGLRLNGLVDVIDRWQKPGDNNKYQRASGGLSPEIGPTDINQGQSNAAVSDASFIRLRNVSLNYLLPSLKKNVEANIYLQAQNLWTITNYVGPDPDHSASNILPPLKTITLGLQLTF